MGYTKVCVCVLLLYYVFNSYHAEFGCLILIPERAEVIFYSKEYFEDTPIFNVRRYGRKGDYVVNLIFTNKKVLDNTIAVDIIFYQYLHNEYRRSFPEMHFQLCYMIKTDFLTGKTLRAAGLTTCPIEPGGYAITNMTFNTKFRFEWPYEKGMMEFTLKSAKSELLAKGALFATFKGDNLKK